MGNTPARSVSLSSLAAYQRFLLGHLHFLAGFFEESLSLHTPFFFLHPSVELFPRSYSPPFWL